MAGVKGRSSRITIKDVAARAGVSVSAVSHVMTGRSDIGPATRERVLAAADALKWQPAAAARALSQAKTFSVGFIAHRSLKHLIEDPFFTGLIVGVQDSLAEAGYNLLIRTIASDAEELAAYRRLISGRSVDGFLLMRHRRADPRYPLIIEAGLPAVAIGETARGCPFPTVSSAQDGLVDGIRTLYGFGHRRFAYLGGPPGSLAIEHRCRLVQAEVVRLGGTVEHVSIASDDTLVDQSLLLARSHDHPTAWVFSTDIPALTAIRGLAEHGVVVPRDLSVLGHDDVAAAHWAHPALSTVRMDVEGLADRASRVLLAALTDGVAGDGAVEPTRFVERGSTGPAPTC